MRVYKMDESLHLPTATVGTTILYGYSGETILFALWFLYLIILIAKNIPDLLRAYPIIGRVARSFLGWVRREK